MRTFTITDEAIQLGRDYGLCGDIEKRMKRMARRAAPVTSEHGNRRFHQWFMQIKDGTVQSIIRLYQ